MDALSEPRVSNDDVAAHVAESHPDAATHAAAGHDATTVNDEHEDRPPGPIDWAAWRAAILGVAVGGVICLLLYLAIR